MCSLFAMINPNIGSRKIRVLGMSKVEFDGLYLLVFAVSCRMLCVVMKVCVIEVWKHDVDDLYVGSMWG